MRNSLFARMTAFPNLLLAFQRAQRGKRFRPNVSMFSLNVEKELLALQHELQSRTYQPGPYRTFYIRDKKLRMISAAPFRDRVVHHALCNIIEPIFERGFLDDSYACRKGKGTHAAADRAWSHVRRFPYVLKCDISRYFPSIDHDILLAKLQRRIWDEGVVWLLGSVIDGSNPQPPVLEYFPGDDLFEPSRRKRGLPIGNQTSQFFANVYLDDLDHYVREHLKVPGYVRYVDDFLLFHRDKSELQFALKRIREFCEGIRLRLHPRKCTMSRTQDGVTFLGYRLFPTHRRLDAHNVRRFSRQLRCLAAAVGRGSMTEEDARRRVQSWVAHARHADTKQLRETLLSGVNWAA